MDNGVKEKPHRMGRVEPIEPPERHQDFLQLYREHEAALRAEGAAIYDVNGALIGSGPTVDLSRAVPRQRSMPAEFAF